MEEFVFARENGWLPTVGREDGQLLMTLIGGTGPLHDPRSFTFPIEEVHLTVIRSSLARHLLLYSALLPLADDAGTQGPLDGEAAAGLLDRILLADAAGVDRDLLKTRWDRRTLVAHGANLKLMQRGKVLESLRHATATSDWGRVTKYLGR